MEILASNLTSEAFLIKIIVFAKKICHICVRNIKILNVTVALRN